MTWSWLVESSNKKKAWRLVEKQVRQPQNYSKLTSFGSGSCMVLSCFVQEWGVVIVPRNARYRCWSPGIPGAGSDVVKATINLPVECGFNPIGVGDGDTLRCNPTWCGNLRMNFPAINLNLCGFFPYFFSGFPTISQSFLKDFQPRLIARRYIPFHHSIIPLVSHLPSALHYGAFWKWGYPNSWLVYSGKSH